MPGTPGISDPGEELVAMCYRAGVTVQAVPGAAACITAVTTSGLPCRRFAFEAFLPRDKKERAEILEELKSEMRTMIIYEAPHRLKQTLGELHKTLGGDRRITVTRELTKKHEEKLQMTIAEAVDYYNANDPRGEYVLVVAGKSKEAAEEEKRMQWDEVSLADHMKHYESQGMDRKAAMKAVAKDLGVTKRDIYRQLLAEES